MNGQAEKKGTKWITYNSIIIHAYAWKISGNLHASIVYV